MRYPTLSETLLLNSNGSVSDEALEDAVTRCIVSVWDSNELVNTEDYPMLFALSCKNRYSISNGVSLDALTLPSEQISIILLIALTILSISSVANANIIVLCSPTKNGRKDTFSFVDGISKIYWATLFFSGKFVIKLLDHDPSTMTSTYYRQFDYVFKYDILSGPYEWFRRSLETKPIPEVTFFVPDLFAEDVPDIEATPQSLLFACSISVSVIWKMVPIEHNAFDYEKIYNTIFCCLIITYFLYE
jgi:hypothetical protein